MARITFFIDGFNLYHAIDNSRLPNSAKWLDLNALCHRFIKSPDTIAGINYYSAYAKWKPDAVKRHRLYVAALKSTGVRFVEGRFHKNTKYYRVNKKTVRIKSHEEKQSDVALAVEVVQGAYTNSYDKAIIISADGDMMPAIKIVKSIAPPKNIEVIFPLGLSSIALGRVAKVRRMLDKDILNSLFPAIIPLPSGRQIDCPPEYLS